MEEEAEEEEGWGVFTVTVIVQRSSYNHICCHYEHSFKPTAREQASLYTCSSGKMGPAPSHLQQLHPQAIPTHTQTGTYGEGVIETILRCCITALLQLWYCAGLNCHLEIHPAKDNCHDLFTFIIMHSQSIIQRVRLLLI